MAANDRAGLESLESTSRLRNLLISSRGMNCGINNIIANIYIYNIHIYITYIYITYIYNIYIHNMFINH